MSRDSGPREPGERAADDSFRCSCCGEWHAEVPLAFHFPAPATWSTELEGAEGCELGSDMCVVKSEQFFILGLIRVPILDDARHFEWGVWVSLSRENFLKTAELLGDRRPREHRTDVRVADHRPSHVLRDHPASENDGPTRPVGLRPLIEVEPTDHPLAIEQREGITREALTRRVEALLHPV